ncbi:amidohydrolase family protein [Halomarina salina]|uniref:Amidohydrolase family protein n=1 Tax=Halomarina salina TaxID=1872699 RepID=A0ABD5RLS1_9EURY
MSDAAADASRDDPTPDDRFVPAIDCHVHLMPERLVAAIRGALTDEAGWGFPHPSTQGEMERTLRAAGIERYCALPYAHKPDIARELNAWVAERADTSEMVVPFATVHGDDEVGDVVREAFEAGARGLKFQCPVQRVAPDDPRLDPAYELAAEYDRPILFHGGTAPMFEDSPHVGVERFRAFVDSYPEVRACCAHMGTFETEAFVDVLAANDNVFLDTCFAMSSAVGESMAFDPASIPDSVFEEHSERIMYGSDYPNIPHSYRSEREHLLSRDLPESTYRDLFHDTAERFLGER